MLETILESILSWVVPICEIVAIIVILISVGIAFFHYIRNLFASASRDIKIDLMSGMSLGIEFAMAAEILKTLQKQDLEQLLLLGGVILIRVVLALMIHFELRGHSPKKKKDE